MIQGGVIMRFEIKYKNINGFTRKTRIRARSSEEAIKNFKMSIEEPKY